MTFRRTGGLALTAALAGLLLLPACIRRKPAEVNPIVPSIKVNRLKVPLGSAIEITYTWTVEAGAKKLDQDYWALVHFLDNHEVMLFSDDHPLGCNLAWGTIDGVLYLMGSLAEQGKGLITLLAVQMGFREAGKHSVEFTEDWGQLLNLSVFFLFGLLLARVWDQVKPAHLLYALLSLTVVRILPVAVALTGTGLSRATVLFMGWFGPRGLASIVLGLVYLEQQTHQPDGPTIRLAVMATVLLRIFAHGLTALPGINTYARKLGDLPPGAHARSER